MSLHVPQLSSSVLGRVRFCPMDNPKRVMRRRVDRIQLEGAVSRVDEVVPGPGGNDDGGMTVDPLPMVQLGTAAACQGHAAAAFHAEKLVGVGMDLHADIPARRDAHQGNLQVFSRPESGSEIPVGIGSLVNVHDKRHPAVILKLRRTGPSSLFVHMVSSCLEG